MDSAIFSHEPPKGVYKGMIPWLKNHYTKSGDLCPLRLSRTSNKRKAGSASGNVGFSASPSNHISYSAGLASGAKVGGTGNLAKMSVNSCFNQGCNTAFGQLVTPFTLT